NVIPTTLHLLLSLYPTLRTHHSFPTRRSSDLTTLHEHNNDTCICEDVPVLDGFPAEGMLRKQREDCLHRGKSDRKEEVNDHQSCHRWIPQYPPPPSKYSSHTTIGEKNYSTCSF